MNVYNSSDYLNAMADGVSVEYFHNWLAKPEQADAIVCFNHPQKDAYNDFHCYNEETRGRMKLIELINGGRAKFYPSFLNALAKGWKVSPSRAATTTAGRGSPSGTPGPACSSPS